MPRRVSSAYSSYIIFCLVFIICFLLFVVRLEFQFFPGRNPCKLPSRIPGGPVLEDKIRYSLRSGFAGASFQSVYPLPLALLLLTRCLRDPTHLGLTCRAAEGASQGALRSALICREAVGRKIVPEDFSRIGSPPKPKEVSS